jgi:membrane protease YdiL (CAAX protease family)
VRREIGIGLVYGVLLAGIFVWRRNLVTGTAAHALYNFLVLLT